jgi:hypothetical protein
MVGILAACAALALQPQFRHDYPSMDQVRCISASSAQLFIAVPRGVYVVDRPGYSYNTALTSADGLAGAVELCAYNPVRGELLITTEERLYSHIPKTGTLTALNPPFRTAISIGIAADAAWFETESGLWRKHRVADQYTRGTPPAGITWYGERDSTRPSDYTFLTPWIVVDEQLTGYELTLARPDARSRRLFVAADGYGVLVYNSLRSSLPEASIRFGPPARTVRSIERRDDRLWLLSADRLTVVNPAAPWQYYSTLAGLYLPPDIPALSRGLLALGRRETVRAVLQDPDRLLVGTDRGLVQLGQGGSVTSVFDTHLPVNAVFTHSGQVVIGTPAGLFALDQDSAVQVEDPFFRTDWGVFSSARTSDGRLWLGTLGGIVSLDSADIWQHLVPPGFDLTRPVSVLAAVDSLVFAGNGAGVVAYNTRSQAWTYLTAGQDLPADSVTALHADSASLWVATPGMLTRVELKGLK